MPELWHSDAAGWPHARNTVFLIRREVSAYNAGTWHTLGNIFVFKAADVSMGKDCPVCPKRGKIHKLLTLCRVFFWGGDFGYILPAVFSVVSTWCSLYSNFRLWGQNRSYVKRRFLPLRSPAINFTGYSGGISGNIWIWRNSSGFPLLFATWGFRIRSLRLLYFSFLFYLFFSRNHTVFNPVEFYFPFPFLSFLFRRIPESAYPFRLRETDGKSVRLHFALVPLCVLLFFWLFVFS